MKSEIRKERLIFSNNVHRVFDCTKKSFEKVKKIFDSVVEVQDYPFNQFNRILPYKTSFRQTIRFNSYGSHIFFKY